MQPRLTYKPTIENLESRELLAAGISAYVQNSNLIIQGTVGNDYLSVTQSAGRLSVYGAQIAVGSSRTGSIDATTVARVIINSYDGNDTVIFDTLTKDAIVTAGAGNDAIYGGAGNDLIDGGAGDDMISGGAGNDRITTGVSASEHDTVFGGDGFNWYYRPFNPSTPIVGGATATDIHQGDAPLCQTAAAIAEAATQGHNFANDIHYLGSSTYEVKLYGNLSTQKVRFDGWTNDQDLTMANGEYWFVLLQRTRLQGLGLDPVKEYSNAEWDAWNTKTRNRLYSIGEALYSFTGSTSYYQAIGAANPQTLATALGRGDYLVAQSRSGGGISPDGIVRSHAYAILGVYQENGAWKVRLYNPWGIDRDNGTTLDSLSRSAAADDGVITLSWKQFTDSNNFLGFFVAAKR